MRSGGYNAIGLVPAILLVLALLVSRSQAAAPPVTPCSSERPAISPAYGAVDGRPTIETWQDLSLGVEDTCSKAIRGRMRLVVALAGRFRSAKSLEELAARLGAISSMKGLLYWSISDGRWRELISDAFALRAPTPDARRPDFSAEEILSGRPLYFAQDDTRSTGLNLYSMTVRKLGAGRMAVEIVNLTPIRFLLVTLFEPRSLYSVQFIGRSAPDVWDYYALSAMRDGSLDGHEGSFINRAAALYRFVRGVPGDGEPPLAP